MSTTFKDTLPRDLVTHISAICGQRGEEWFDRLPDVISELEDRWSIAVGEPFSGIEYNFVAPARRTGGEDVVVKISPPFERLEIHCEAKYLRAREGSGVVKLLAEDRERHAVLLERALPGTALFVAFENKPMAAVPPAIDMLKSVLRPPPLDMSDVDTLDSWFQRFRRYDETKFPKDHAKKAIEIYDQLSAQAGRTFYLHGDFHPGNIVTAAREPYLVIDPKGIVGHIGYDIAVFLSNLSWWRKDDPELPAFLNNAVSQFSAGFEIDFTELRQWAYASMVIGSWWTFEDMPKHYDEAVALSEVWGV
jgi:streptomycin 6-kinase